jgi:xanthine/uracil permease
MKVSIILRYFITVFIFFIVFAIFQPKQGHKPKIGKNLLIYDKNGLCYHIHHWMLSLIVILLIISIVLISKGLFNTTIIIILGAFSGIMLSGFLYKDFLSIKQKCEK